VAVPISAIHDYTTKSLMPSAKIKRQTDFYTNIIRFY